MSLAIPLVDQLKKLAYLQELDLKIDAVKKDQSFLPEVLKTVDADVRELDQRLKVGEAKLKEIEKDHSQLKSALVLNQERMTRAQAKLDAAVNAQSYQAAVKELDQLKRLSSSLEQQVEQMLAVLESAQSQLQEFQNQYDRIVEKRTEEADVVCGKENKLQGDLGELLSERLRFSEGLDLRMLARYDRVREARSGLGIVPAVAGRCHGCNMVVPPQVYNEIVACVSLHACPSCHRILFVPEVS